MAAARKALGERTELMVDATGAYQRAEAVAKSQEFAAHRVSWFEEPVSSDDLEGLRFVRDRAPPGMQIAAGEYGYDAVYFRRMLERGAVEPDRARPGIGVELKRSHAERYTVARGRQIV